MDFSNELTKMKAARGCQVLSKTSNYRPMWVKVLEFSNPKLCDGIFDVPTPLNVIY